MFNNLIESQSHRKEFKRRSRFLLATTAAYALAFFVAGIASIYAYDAQLEAQNNDLTVLSWVPPVTVTPADQPHPIQQIRRPFTPNARVDRNVSEPVRTAGVSRTDDPTKVPPVVGTEASPVPPVTGHFRQGATNVDPPGVPGDQNGCPTCSGNGTTPVRVPDETPPPPVKVAKPVRVPSTLLRSNAISLPQPQYPPLAKIAGVHGPVLIQILVDETGRVVSAQVVSGNPMLTLNARDAALRARFTPTILNDQAVKVQGVITYNFVLQ